MILAEGIRTRDELRSLLSINTGTQIKRGNHRLVCVSETDDPNVIGIMHPSGARISREDWERLKRQTLRLLDEELDEDVVYQRQCQIRDKPKNVGLDVRYPHVFPIVLAVENSAATVVQRFDVGDRVKVDIPDQTDPDYERYHGMHGTVIEVTSDDAALVTGDDRDSVIYRVDLDKGDTIDLRWRDLRPV